MKFFCLVLHFLPLGLSFIKVIFFDNNTRDGEIFFFPMVLCQTTNTMSRVEHESLLMAPGFSMTSNNSVNSCRAKWSRVRLWLAY